MRIAFVTFEYPPAVAIGGIGTYAWEASKMLAKAGVSVEVFAAGKSGREPAEQWGIRVHRFQCEDRSAFRDGIVQLFAARHRQAPFDLIESPEIGAEGRGITHVFPELAAVAKLHTPTYLVGRIGRDSPSLSAALRFRLGALRRGRWASLKPQPYRKEQDLEYFFTRSVDEIASPSKAIAEQLIADWDLPADCISVFPYPFHPDASLLTLPVPTEARTIGFLGRLEARKGVVEFAKSIPLILKRSCFLRFRFIGPTWPYRQGDMESWIREHCHAFLDRITFTGAVSRDELPVQLGRCDVVVLPSRWESFGLVCPEAMAAGRAVIGSAAGGMAEVIQPGVSGLLVPPLSPQGIAEAVNSLVERPERIAQLGVAGRQRVLEHLAPERILPLQLSSYERAIRRAKERNR